MKDNRLLSRSNSWLHARRRQLVAAAACGLSATLVLLAGCGPVKLVANTNIPPPLVVKIPIGVALFVRDALEHVDDDPAVAAAAIDAAVLQKVLPKFFTWTPGSTIAVTQTATARTSQERSSVMVGGRVR